MNLEGRQASVRYGMRGNLSLQSRRKSARRVCDLLPLGLHRAHAFLRSPPALYTLLEINKFYPEIVNSGKCEVYIDGGIRRGTDVVKALCLGAKGVGMGRPFMYALTYGEEGVRHAIDSKSTSRSSWAPYSWAASREG